MKKIVPFLILLIIALAIILPGLMIKAKIVCLDNDAPCPEEIGGELSSLNGQRIFNAKRQLKKILNNNFLVLEYSTQFKLPNILQVNVLPKKPAFAVKEKENEIYYLVDASGCVLAKAVHTELPYIVFEGQKYEAGDNVDEETLFALNLIDGIYQMYQTKVGIVEEDVLKVRLPEGVEAILPLAGKDRDLLLGSLRLIYSNIKEAEEVYTQIDMRYENPVLR